MSAQTMAAPLVADGGTFRLQNVYAGSFRDSDLALRTNYSALAAMPIQFHAVAGKPGVYLMQNKYEGEQDGGATDKWISFGADSQCMSWFPAPLLYLFFVCFLRNAFSFGSFGCLVSGAVNGRCTIGVCW